MEYMKLRFSILFTIILAVLYGCRDDAPDLRMPLDEIVGVWEEENVHITFNGVEYLPHSVVGTTLTQIIGEPEAGIKEGELILMSLALSFFDEKNPGQAHDGHIGVWIDCKSISEDKVIFSGETYIPISGVDVNVDGTITGKGTDKEMYLNINYKQHSDILIGRTFEIDFTDGSAYPEITSEAENADIVDIPQAPQIEPMPVPDFIRLAFDNINDTYYSRLGYEKARIRFNDDMSYTLWFKDATTGEYVQSINDLHYYYTDDILFFIDPLDFVKSFVPYFDYWGELDYGMMLHQYRVEFNRKMYSVLSMDYELKDDKLIVTHRHPLSMASSFCNGLLMPWPWMKLNHLDEYFTPKAVFTEVK